MLVLLQLNRGLVIPAYAHCRKAEKLVLMSHDCLIASLYIRAIQENVLRLPDSSYWQCVCVDGCIF